MKAVKVIVSFKERVVFWRRAGGMSVGEVWDRERERSGVSYTNVARTVGA